MKERRCVLCCRTLPITDFSAASHGRNKGELRKACDRCSEMHRQYDKERKKTQKPKPSITLCNAYNDYIFC